MDVEGRGQGKQRLYAAADTWRAIVVRRQAGKRINVGQEGVPPSLLPLQVRARDEINPNLGHLDVTSFGYRCVLYEPRTASPWNGSVAFLELASQYESPTFGGTAKYNSSNATANATFIGTWTLPRWRSCQYPKAAGADLGHP